jgi:hypothetical protein
MDKFYKINNELGRWDIDTIIKDIRTVVYQADIRFDYWRATNELKRYVNGKPTEEWCDSNLHYNNDVSGAVVNGDLNLTTDLSQSMTLGQRLFDKTWGQGCTDLIPEFRGTVVEQLYDYAKLKFNRPVRIRCQNRTVGGVFHNVYWHKTATKQNINHIPLWTNPGHILLFSPNNFQWHQGFDNIDAKEPMDFVGHYIPASGKAYELYTGQYMHSVAALGVGSLQPRHLQTRCHLILWPEFN